MPTSSGGTSSSSGGAMALISSTLLSGAAANIDITGIAGTYNHLLLTFQVRADGASATVNSVFRLNGDSGANYDRAVIGAFGANPTFAPAAAQTSLYVADFVANSAAAGTVTVGQILIPFYAKTTFNKTIAVAATGIFGVLGTTTTYELFQTSGMWRSTAAVTQVTLAPASGNFMAGSGLTVHGIL